MILISLYFTHVLSISNEVKTVVKPPVDFISSNVTYVSPTTTQAYVPAPTTQSYNIPTTTGYVPTTKVYPSNGYKPSKEPIKKPIKHFFKKPFKKPFYKPVKKPFYKPVKKPLFHKKPVYKPIKYYSDSSLPNVHYSNNFHNHHNPYSFFNLSF